MELGPFQYGVTWNNVVKSQILIMKIPLVNLQPPLNYYVDYDGMRYATLANVPVEDINVKYSLRGNGPIEFGHGYLNFMSLPLGWSIAPSAPVAVTSYSWNTQALCFSSGSCVISNSSNQQQPYVDSGLGSNSAVVQDGNGRWALSPLMVAKNGAVQIMITSPSPSGISNSVLYTDGNRYATLANTNINGTINVGQSGFVRLPVGWIVAPDSPTVRKVIASYSWGTTVLIVNSGKGYYSNNTFAKGRSDNNNIMIIICYDNI